MDSGISTSLQTTPLKRSHDGQPIQPDPAVITSMPAAGIDHDVREQSPALSTTGSSLSDPPPSLGQAPSSESPSEQKPKKRKLTFAERQVELAVKKAERAARDKQKAEEKARKDEEKRVKDGEKRKREEEKEAARREREVEKEKKRQVKEAEKKTKDDEKARKEEEKQKKERSQLRIGAFFGRPAPACTPPSTPDDLSSGLSSRRSSLGALDAEKPQFDVKPNVVQNSEYEKLFPSFFVFENTDIAPTNRFLKLQRPFNASYNIDVLSLQNEENIGISAIIGQFRKDYCSRLHRGRNKHQSVRQIVDGINGSVIAPVDLTEDNADSQVMEGLDDIPVKFLCFRHPELDLQTRPPYQGTYTRHVSPRTALKIPRNPFHRGLPDTNYDYDSEVEWEPPQEGDEDINLEDEESEEEGDEEEMADFLDDDGDVVKRRILVREMEPISSGLCWEGAISSSGCFNMQDYRIDLLDEGHRFPIDPHSTLYWSKAPKFTTAKELKASGSSANVMQPPRLPLSNVGVPNVFVAQGFLPAIKIETPKGDVENKNPPQKPASKFVSNKTPKLISDDLLPAFKQAVSGSDLTKAGLIEILKKQFPKVSKDTIKDTLSTIAVREGAKEADKKWILIN